jgi:hexokinase
MRREAVGGSPLFIFIHYEPICFNKGTGSMTGTNRCDQFLLKHHLSAGQYDAGEIVQAFLDEMSLGLAGTKSSLAMIPTFITVPGKAPKNEKIIVLDAGGTNFRTALVAFDRDSVPHIESFVNNPMPGIEKELGKEDFFNLIADYIKPVLAESDRLGFCFSYPAVIDRERDGRLLYWTKEIKAPGVVGQKILASLAQTLQKRSLPCPSKMLMLNDTVAALLAGVTATTFSREHRYIGFILGTGTNTAYIEKNGLIKKETGLPAAGDMAINCESANFNKINRGDIDIAFDNSTSGPGKYVLEKMVSGAYLGNLCHRILVTAASEGVLSKAAQQDQQTITTQSLDALLSGEPDKEHNFKECSDDERALIRAIVSAVVERAALLTAINMAAPIIKSEKDGGGKKKYCISADGSVFYKLYSFRERAEKYLAEILKPYTVEYKIVKINDAPIIGTAVAGLA